jgi:hypothetical protein
MSLFTEANLKYSFTTHPVPTDAMHSVQRLSHSPQTGDLMVTEVVSLGRHSAIEDRHGARINIFPGDYLVGAFGNRYATDQYEGYVPSTVSDTCDLLSVGGVIGEVASQHSTMSNPTPLRIVGSICDAQGSPLNLRQFGQTTHPFEHLPEVIVVVGSAMNSGKTTTVGTLVRGLSRMGKRVAATKITGTAASKDRRFFQSCGATRVLDFTDAGYPSTYMLAQNELMHIAYTLLTNLATQPLDYIVVEIADGIFQRETRMLLEHHLFTSLIDHLFFSANDSLSAECGVRMLNHYQLPLRGVAGIVTQSPLAIREIEDVCGMRCLTLQQLADTDLLSVLQAPPAQRELPAATTLAALHAHAPGTPSAAHAQHMLLAAPPAQPYQSV